LLLNRTRLLADPKRLGKWGEKRCESFLKKKGLKTLARNYASKTGEIDLVMVDGDRSIVFVEVKTRTGEDLTAAESVVTAPRRPKPSEPPVISSPPTKSTTDLIASMSSPLSSARPAAHK